MLQPKTVFTAISVWFSFHLVVFFVIGPSMLKDVPDMSEAAIFISSSMMQFSELLVFIGVLMYLCRELEIAPSQKVPFSLWGNVGHIRYNNNKR